MIKADVSVHWLDHNSHPLDMGYGGCEQRSQTDQSAVGGWGFAVAGS
jgi:hypothetical protein